MFLIIENSKHMFFILKDRKQKLVFQFLNMFF